MFVDIFIRDTKHLESSLLTGDLMIDVKKCVNSVMGFLVEKILRIVV